MTERGLLCNKRTVLAILAGKQTQDRRPVTVSWQKGTRCVPYDPYFTESDGVLMAADECGDWHRFEDCMASPFGVPGDILYVRETLHCEFTSSDSETPSGAMGVYSADGTVVIVAGKAVDWSECRRDPFYETCPSIHMPKELSRIRLLVKRVWVERVQDISRKDAHAEGFHPSLNGLEHFGGKSYGNANLAFAACWESIYGEGNPWVWACEFERVEI